MTTKNAEPYTMAEYDSSDHNDPRVIATVEALAAERAAHAKMRAAYDDDYLKKLLDAANDRAEKAEKERDEAQAELAKRAARYQRIVDESDAATARAEAAEREVAQCSDCVQMVSAERDTLRKLVNGPREDLYARAIAERDTLRTDNERLREALERIHCEVVSDIVYDMVSAALQPSTSSDRVSAHLAALEDLRERCAKVVVKVLAFNSQRAVSWHEVQDAADAIRALPFRAARKAGP